MAETKFKKSRIARELTVTLDYEDTSATELFTLPKSARIIGWFVNVRTAFSGGTTELDVGISGNTDYFIDGIGIGSVGQVTPTTYVKKPGEETTAMTTVYGLVGSSNTAGSLELTCLFSLEQSTPLA
jgi:hypothetical protein